MLNEFMYWCIGWLEKLFFALMPWGGFVAGATFPWVFKSISRKWWILGELLSFVVVVGVMPLGIPALIRLMLGWIGDDRSAFVPRGLAFWWCVCLVLGFAVSFLFSRKVWPAVVDWAQRFRKSSARQREGRTDARTIQQQLPREVGNFDPARFFRTQDGVFVGLNEKRKPIFIPEAVWKESHIFLSGRTRSGKGVAAQSLLCQSLMRDEFVVVLDPKGDQWLPSVLRARADSSGRPFVFVDLSPAAPCQINPLMDMDAEDAEGAFLAAFSLSDKGEAADFYRISDRRAALECARYIGAHPGVTFRDVFASESGRWEEDSKGFVEALRELADLPSVNAAGGTGLGELARQGGVLYVCGDMENTRMVRMQRMLLIRCQQLAKRRQHYGIERPFLVFADEFRVHISRPFITALAASAGWGLRCVLACQSFQDLLQVPADLNPQAVKGAIVENCAISLSYRLKDPDTAEWIAKSTGSILVDDEVRTVQANWAQAETFEAQRSVRQAERYRVDVNQLLYLPKGCGVLIGATDAPGFCFASPVKVDISMDASRPTFAKVAPDGVNAVIPLAQEAIQL